MRCSDCNKFVSTDPEDSPEVDLTVTFDGEKTGTVEGTVTITAACTECGSTLQQFQFEVSEDFEVPEADRADFAARCIVTEDGAEATEEMIKRKRHFGYTLVWKVSVSDPNDGPDKLIAEGTASDRIPASDMEEY
jgi:hypothetical protein